MATLILILFCQTNPYVGTFQSSLQTLTFVNDEKCFISIPAAWDGSRQLKLRWREAGDTPGMIELRRSGLVKYRFIAVQKGDYTYLVEEDQLNQFRKDLQILRHSEPDESGHYTDEYYVASEHINRMTLKKSEK